MTADLADTVALVLLGALVVVAAAVAIRVGIILGGRLDARLEREEDDRDA